ncbi:MAG: hypothetical protein H8K07_04615 [Nitrospira sp.]|nr:hypothetical protein [Nitrospira sp.]MDI3464549.1 Rrf2-linked NADH-flavin reductase [Nitrospira sp.]
MRRRCQPVGVIARRTLNLSQTRMLKDANGQSRISTQDYAVAMLDEVDQPAHVRQRFTVGY